MEGQGKDQPYYDRWLSARDVMAMTGMARSTVTNRIKNGQIPQPFTPFDNGKLYWWESEIIDWMRSRDRREESDERAS